MGDSTTGKAQAAIPHGGNLGRARRLFPQAPQPWIDLSTGINPHSYPHSPLPATTLSRLPDPFALDGLKEIAARAYGAPSATHVAAAPGTQILLPMVAQMAHRGEGRPRAAILSPTYAEHARAARMNGFAVEETDDLAALAGADLAVVVNPNNPTGRIVPKPQLMSLAAAIGEKGGLLVIDEAFGDASGEHESLCDAAGLPGLIVLRSFGKFYGMAGLRLGFAIAAPPLIAQIEARLGPWAVSGPALHIADEALCDHGWRQNMQEHLHAATRRLDALLETAGLAIVGGTDLFRLARHHHAAEIFTHLGQCGILVRAFTEHPQALRFGLPGEEDAWRRLARALEGGF